MKSDTGDSGKPDDGEPIERAHLRHPNDTTHTIFRYPASPDLGDVVRRYWIPVWRVPPGREAPQHVLRYPVCLVVITEDYARFYGVESGLSTTVLTGEGWAAGVMLAPAAGALVAGGPLASFTDRIVEVPEVLGDAGVRVVDRVREMMRRDPRSPEAHHAVMGVYDEVFRRYLPVDDEGRLVNRVVAFVEDNPDVLRVEQVRNEFGLSERALQRLVHRRIGLTPKWLIQRRRLQEAAGRLREKSGSLSEVAAVLGYADQPHFVRDFKNAVGVTPGAFADLYSGPSSRA
ncbi:MULTISPECIES: helix-turn-helix domain-containing protein [unclassified Rhodococcus (in: high G+C Gram-positive bacteria)]|uniref:helix-turn-helix domain-containing protein n=1 Tax=unclassified Rhodococcus (in: high G+C Gram-positive bacteria) TaxID=192944 RepID=UPI00146DD647|nr:MULTISPECIES: AraC family transcriptional regulator [unclassified Rhodococcus (in: high G+C Gram-positive bacteria)]NMD97120.1 helix-turn-helix transcriptional regulator [Rhodococcus sp. BL-253-APC-6A1W]NME80399.1 helix-turn-helix transcriptional regulator [Rhodococcus sp. 105337]